MGSNASKARKRAIQLSEEEIQFLLKNTRFSRQQVMEWHQDFLVSSYSLKIYLSSLICSDISDALTFLSFISYSFA